MKSTHSKNLQVGFGLSLFLLLASSVASFISIRQMINSAAWVNHTNIVIQKLESVISYAKDAETGQRGYLLTKDESYLLPYVGAYDKVQAGLAEVKKLTADNPVQQEDLSQLSDLLQQRFNYLRIAVDKMRAGEAIDFTNLQRGQELMRSARELIDKMQESEQQLLIARTTKANQFARSTPLLIIIAAVLALLITLYFYKRVNQNFTAINLLNEELLHKDEEIANRIRVIEQIANRISQGDYSIRVTGEEKAGLGGLAGSLNKMASSLEHSFTELSGKEWLQKGAAELNEKMTGEKTIGALSREIVSFLANYTQSSIGAFYMAESEDRLVLKGGYALSQQAHERVETGKGLIGQCARDKKPVAVNGMDDPDFTISFAAGNIRPKSIYVFPVLFEDIVMGVIELGSRKPFTELHKELFDRVSGNIGIAMNVALNRVRLQELLEETQSQAEELQSQHNELESLNTELELQAQKLQASEEELKVQQEELMETNQELEERSRMLEEKNHLVVIRNLEVQKKAEELAESARYKSEFLANMSHELRTPLNSILLLSRLLAENGDNNLKDEQVEYARVIQSSGNGLLQLIDEILDLSKIESGKMQLDYELVSVNDVTQHMEKLFAPMAKEKNVALTVTIDPALSMQVETDRMRLEQILKNLLSNALKFTNKGYINFVVRASHSRSGFVDFAVKDSGIGIAADKQELIFEAFQQADGSTRRKYGGTGLGLSISRQLARLLGGDIALKSEPGEGSEFIASIPQNRKVAEAASKEKPVPSIATEPVYKREPADMNNGRQPSNPFLAPVIPSDIPDDRDNLESHQKIILIVEDDTVFANTLLEFTRKKGYKGIIAVRGDQALELAKQYRPMGILLDIQLPVKSGWDVMDEIKKDPQTKHIPVHIISSYEVKKESLVKGAVDFVHKPVAFEKINEVFQRIETVISKDPKKVLIVEDNPKHAKALAYFLSTYNINSTISENIGDSIQSLSSKEVDCVILDMGIPDMKAYETLDTVKKNAGLGDIPVLIFTGKSLSRAEEIRIKQYADSIVMKTAHSYQRILDEVSLFLHLVEENTKQVKKMNGNGRGTGSLAEVLSNKKVLIADDDVRNIFSLTRVLEKHKMQVISAIDGREALQALEKDPGINIVLMDIMMPEMDGFEAISHIRKQPQWKNLPVIAVTAKAMTGDRDKCIRAGASDYISKPVDIDQLVSLLRIWLYENNK